MENQAAYVTSLPGVAEDLLVELFCDTFGPEKTQYLSIRHPFVAIEIDGGKVPQPTMKRSREIEYIEFSRHIFGKLSKEESDWIKVHYDSKLEEYYG